jgi:hypothetical protein
VVLCKFSVGLYAARIYSYDLGAQILEIFVVVSETARLFRASRRLILRVEIKNNIFFPRKLERVTFSPVCD